MSTDPRIAALVKALRKVLPRRGDLVSSTDWENAASGILAALPPDWCGHIGVEEVIAQAQARLVASEIAADREITRLRNTLDEERLARALHHLGAAPIDGYGYGYRGQSGRNLAAAIAKAYREDTDA